MNATFRYRREQRGQDIPLQASPRTQGFCRIREHAGEEAIVSIRGVPPLI
jgi:hypothetical protein